MFFKLRLRLIAGLLCVCVLQAQMTPSAPVQNFRLPRFGDNGYTQWVLQGGKGIYDSAEQIRIEEMALRIYSGDERMALEMTIDSPEATLLTKENRAVSDGPITIVGANFKVSGVGWTWNGVTKEIEVKYDVVVEFTQGMAEMLTGTLAAEEVEAGAAEEAELTEIYSHSLLLQTTAEAYRFKFAGSVHAVSGEMDLKGELLVAIADAPTGKKTGGSSVDGGQLDSIHQLTATDQVVIQQADYVLKAGHAEFMLREQTAHFSGLPQIMTTGVFLSGATMDSQAGKVVVKGDAGAGRAQMIVSQTGGLGIMGADVLSSETIVLSEVITMLELDGGNQFLFEGSVGVMSGAMSMRSDRLTLFAEESVSVDGAAAVDEAVDVDVDVDADDEGASPALQVGVVKQLIAEGNVQIEQEDRVATANQVTFYPQEERADLAGSPRIERADTVVVGDSMQLTPERSIVAGSAELRANAGEVIVTGDRMELQPGVAVVQSSTDQRVKVVLPGMPDLGFGNLRVPSASSSQASDATEELAAAPERQTVVQSKALRMIEETGHTLFRFTDTVSVSGTNLNATCGRLEVTAIPASTAAVASGTASVDVSVSPMDVQMIEAFDNVVIQQGERVARSDKAIILPLEGQVVLEGDPVVTDEMGTVAGHRMVLLQGQRRAIVEGDPSTGKRATMTLPAVKPLEQ